MTGKRSVALVCMTLCSAPCTTHRTCQLGQKLQLLNRSLVAAEGEEMGLGKTVEVAALVLSHPAPPVQSTRETTGDGLIVSR